MPDATKSGPMNAEDLRLLGYEVVTELPPADLGLETLNCRAFCGVDSGFERLKHTFVYFMASNTEQALRQHLPALRRFGGFIVIPNTLRDSAAGRLLHAEFPQRLRVYDDMMWTRISSLLAPYLQHVSGLVETLREEHYVPPSLPGLQIQRDALDYLVDFCSGAALSHGNIIVVEANPGVGKTALATMIAWRLSSVSSRVKVVPVFLPADLWRSPDPDPDPENLIDVLRRMKFPLCDDEDAFSRLLQQGYIALIFDGFDELRNDSQTPKQRFEWLQNIADSSNARIIVTVRSSFWEREVAGAGDLDTVDSVRIEPFSQSDRLAYWRKRLPEPADVEAAARMHGRYISSARETIELFQLPNCASMIADCIARARAEGIPGGDAVPLDESTAKPVDLVERFFAEVMERERVRQGLATTTPAARAAFQEIAIHYRDDELFDETDLELSGVAPADLKLLRDHALLNHEQHGRFRFRYAVVPQRFRSARFLAAVLDQEVTDAVPSDFKTLVESEADGGGELPDQIAKIMTAPEAPCFAKVHHATQHDGLKSLIFHILSAYVSFSMAGQSCADLWKGLVRLLGGTRNSISGLCVNGTIEGYNIGNFAIHDSRFTHLVLNSEVQRLRFETCQFDGALFVPRGCRFVNCDAQGEARLTIASLESGPRLDKDDLRDYLRTALKRFVVRGGGYKTVREHDWRTGEVGQIDAVFAILNELVANGVVQKEPADGRAKMTLTRQGQRWVARFLGQGSLQAGLHDVFVAMLKKAGAARLLR